MILKNQIKDVFENLLKTYKECSSIILCFSFSNEEGKAESFLGGVRIINSSIVLSVINVSQKELRSYSEIIKNYGIKFIFVDVEKKLPFEVILDNENKNTNIEYSNIYAEATERLPFAEIVPWSSTEVTSTSILNLLREELGNNLSGNEITIIGLGAIGFQLSLSLVREGVKVNCFTKNYTRGLIKANSINTIRSDFTLASFNLFKNLRTAILSSSILVECSSSVNTIDKNYINDFQLHRLIIDVGKQAFTSDFIKDIDKQNINFKRLDISNTLSEFIHRKLNPSKITFKKPLKSNFKSKFNLVSGGWKGLPGDIIVDDADNPRFVIGSINRSFKINPIYVEFDEWIKTI